MSESLTAGAQSGFRRTLGTPKVVFMVVAAVAPLAAMVGTVPLAFVIGNGAGVPAMFVFAGLTLLCFSVGYAAMSRRIVNAGGFYSYLSGGLGRPLAVGGGLVAALAYNAMTIGLVGAFAYFANLIGSSFGLTLPWQLWAAFAVVAVAVLGYRRIDLSAKVLAVLMAAEVAILVLLDIAVVIRNGGAALPSASFDPSVVLGAGIGVSLMFALISFIGFESAALYGEEARNPKRTVPMATYISVLLIGSFYALTSWIAVGAVGVDSLVETAGAQMGGLFIGLTDDYLGATITITMQILLCTSLFAGVLAMHGAANRYLFVLGRDRVLPAGLAAVHPRHASPSRASLTQSAITVVVVGIFAAAGLDPYLNLSTTMVGLGTIGIVALQALAALSVIGFFRTRPDRHWWRTALAPGLGFLGLATSVVLILGNFELLTGSASPLINSLPWLLLVTGVAGIGYGLWIRAKRPERYAALADVSRRDVELVSVPTGPAADATEHKAA